MDYNKTILQFIPIILAFLLLAYSKPMAQFSYTILGKLFSVLLIIYYTSFDKMVGLFVCGLVILYYQLDCVDMLVYGEPSSNAFREGFTVSKPEFRSQNCVNGTLKYKNMDVSDEMSDHVFREVKFENDSKCNVCSDACSFSVKEARINKEAEIAPITSRK